MNVVSWILVERKVKVDPWRDSIELMGVRGLGGLWALDPQSTEVGSLGTVEALARSFS